MSLLLVSKNDIRKGNKASSCNENEEEAPINEDTNLIANDLSTDLSFKALRRTREDIDNDSSDEEDEEEDDDEEFKRGSEVEVRYKGREKWFRAFLLNYTTDDDDDFSGLHHSYHVKYRDDGSEESNVPRIRIRHIGQLEPLVIKAGLRCEARYGGGKKCFGGVIIWADGKDIDDSNRENCLPTTQVSPDNKISIQPIITHTPTKFLPKISLFINVFLSL